MRIAILITVGSADAVSRLCAGFAERGLAEHSVVWRLPANDCPCDVLADRVARWSDSVAPMGLTGASNTALHVTEIDAEIEWAVSNIWNTGVRDRLHIDPSLVMPAGPDLLRVKALEAYRRAAVPVGVLGVSVDGTRLGILGGEVPLDGSLAVLTPRGDAPYSGRRDLARDVGRRLRSARTHRTRKDNEQLVISLHAGEPEQDALVFAALCAVAEARERWDWEAGPIEASTARSNGAANMAAVEPWTSAPTAPAASAAAAATRRRRASKINTRRLLEQIAHPQSTTPAARTHRSPTRSGPGAREFLASMMGEASLVGGEMTARFSGGSLCGLSATSGGLLARPIGSFVRGPDGRESAATASTCFSFESDVSRGLRSESVITDGDGVAFGRICSEYSLVGDYDALVVTHRITTEGGRPEYALCAFAVPIGRRRELTIAGRFSDGSGYEYRVGPKAPRTVLWGEAFRVAAGADALSVVPVSEIGRPLTWQLSLLEGPDRRILAGGWYVLGEPAEHTLSMLLVPGEDDGELVERAFNRRLPPAIVTEIEAGAAAGRTTTAKGSSGAPVPRGA